MSPCVAGASVPAFVERSGRTGACPPCCRVLPGLRSRPLLSDELLSGHTGRRLVLPGLRSRPLLSVHDPGAAVRLAPRVAGASVPAFVERSRTRPWPPDAARVLPGLRSRPLLSGLVRRPGGLRGLVLPGLRSRPLLSVGCRGRRRHGVRVLPGLRSRPLLSGLACRLARLDRRRVAGASVPAFVERSRTRASGGSSPAVLPGLRSRPLLSESRSAPALDPALGVAGASVPAFVERSIPSRPEPRAAPCCRGFGPGLC